MARGADIVVFSILRESTCVECGAELSKGSFLRMEKERPLCMTCADLDHLMFLPSGDTALTRRARKHSALDAVVVRFSRTRGCYERQGVLVEETALSQAERECLADADARERARERGAASGTHPEGKCTRLNSRHLGISYAVFCLKKAIETMNGIQKSH